MNGIGERFMRFWFEPQSSATLGVLRIVYGIVVLGWALSLAPDLFPFFTERGIITQQPAYGWWFGPFGVWQSPPVVLGLYAVLVLAAIALVVGWHARIAAVLVFVGVYSFERRNPYVFNAGDDLIRLLAFYLMLAPSGIALSFDRLRVARDGFWQFPLHAPWALRLIQIQLSVIYISTVWAKLRGSTWNDGTAVYYALEIGDLQRFPLPGFLTDWPVIVNAMTWGTLAVEVALGILVWNRALRPWVLALGVGMHLMIDLTLLVGFFSLAIITAYIAFVPGDSMERWLQRMRVRFDRTPAPQPVEPSETATTTA